MSILGQTETGSIMTGDVLAQQCTNGAVSSEGRTIEWPIVSQDYGIGILFNEAVQCHVAINWLCKRRDLIEKQVDEWLVDTASFVENSGDEDWNVCFPKSQHMMMNIQGRVRAWQTTYDENKELINKQERTEEVLASEEKLQESLSWLLGLHRVFCDRWNLMITQLWSKEKGCVSVTANMKAADRSLIVSQNDLGNLVGSLSATISTSEPISGGLTSGILVNEHLTKDVSVSRISSLASVSSQGGSVSNLQDYVRGIYRIKP